MYQSSSKQPLPMTYFLINSKNFEIVLISINIFCMLFVSILGIRHTALYGPYVCVYVCMYSCLFKCMYYKKF